VANLWDSRPGALPQSELNPLTNSVLERNLGRWAEVYFSNPPEKREQAVSKLLEEIRREVAGSLSTEPFRPADLPQSEQLQEAACSVCQHNNPPGHKFCGRCGAPLNAKPSGVKRNASSAPDESSAYSESNRVWRPNRFLDDAAEPEARTGRGWKYLGAGLAIALACFAYLQWGLKPGSSAPVRGTTVAPRASAPPAPLPENASSSPASRPPEKISGLSRGSDIQNSPPAQQQSRSIVPGVEPASQKSRLLDTTVVRKDRDQAESGGPDLRLAQRYLGASMGARDSSEAAKLLWKAVRKQNSTAAVLLSDLYLRGDGVPRSCDQARLLLLAAARRGAPQAIQQLQNLEAYGCR
jgi:hypothetical protein